MTTFSCPTTRCGQPIPADAEPWERCLACGRPIKMSAKAARMTVFRLGEHSFASKAVAKAEFQRILKASDDDVPLTGNDAELVQALIRYGLHPEATEKIGPGIAAVVVRRVAYGTRGFWLRRVDGSAVDFSYLTALNGPPTAEADARAALRWEIDEQIAAFRTRLAPGQICELCEEVLGVADRTHVDHAEPTFNQLARVFAEAVGGWSALTVECVGPTGRQLADRERAQVWRIYHQQTARLRVTHARCNLTRGWNSR